MTARSHKRGNPIYFDTDKKEWLSEDSTPVEFDQRCSRCGQLPTPEGHDACLGTLPGIENACCSHGVGYPYLMFNSESHFQAAVEAIRRTQ